MHALYLAENSPLPTVGAHSVLLDTAGNALCVLRNIAVTVVPFCMVTEQHAYKEGEGDRSLRYWREAHRKFFTSELKEIDATFSEDMLVVCEEFEVVFRA